MTAGQGVAVTEQPGRGGGPRGPLWAWAVVCAAQAGLYLLLLIILGLALWGVYGDGTLRGAANRDAAAVVAVTGAFAVAVAAAIGAGAVRGRRRGLAVTEFVTAGVIVAVSAITAIALLLTHS